MPCRSMPRCTMVCAICGRMPLMMQSAPIRRIAVTVLSRCCATSVSTVGTPVMSMMASSEPVSTMRVSSDSITSCVRLESSVPIIGTASTPSHSLTTGVDSSSSSCCWRWMTSSRERWYVVAVNWASLSTSVEAVHAASNARLGVVGQLLLQPGEQRLLDRHHELAGVAGAGALRGARLRQGGQHRRASRPAGVVERCQVRIGGDRRLQARRAARARRCRAAVGADEAAGRGRPRRASP